FRGGRTPRVSPPRQSYKAPGMPHASAPAWSNGGWTQGQSNPAHARGSTAHARGNRRAAGAMQSSMMGTINPVTTPGANRAITAGTRRTTTGTVDAAAVAGSTATGVTPISSTPYTYTYGYGPRARGYRAYSYGNGYRNRYYGGRHGYGWLQGHNRA